MIFYLKLYFATLLAFFVVDMIWLVGIARGFYKEHHPRYPLWPDHVCHL